MRGITREEVVHDAYTTMTWLSTLDGTEHGEPAAHAYLVVERLLALVTPI